MLLSNKKSVAKPAATAIPPLFSSMKARAFAANLCALMTLVVTIYAILATQLDNQQLQMVQEALENQAQLLQETSKPPNTRYLSHSSLAIFYHFGSLETARLTEHWPQECPTIQKAKNEAPSIQHIECKNKNLYIFETSTQSEPQQQFTLWAMTSNKSLLASMPIQDKLGLALVILALGYLTSRWTSRLLANPIKEITQGAECIAAGNYSLRLAPSAMCEMNSLSNTFNNMARTIEERDRVIRRTAYKDQLTGLDNRAYLTFALKDRIKNAREELSVITWGIDNLETINEVLGHEVADEVLIRIGVKTRRICPENLVIARLEGNVFCIIMPKSLFQKQLEQHTIN